MQIKQGYILCIKLCQRKKVNGQIQAKKLRGVSELKKKDRKVKEKD